MYEWISNLENWLTLSTLTILEIVLGIDNIVFLLLIVGKLPIHQQHIARFLGLSGAMVIRLILLASLTWLTHLKEPYITFIHHVFSLHDLILLCGGLILLCNISTELYKGIKDVQNEQKIKMCSFLGAMIQIIFLDIIFSLDSLITAIGISNNFIIMMASVIISVLVMMFSSELISHYIERYPSIKILALFFLFLIGCKLVLEGFHIYISQNYIYCLIAVCGLLKLFHVTYHQK
ncbi:TerC family protein [Candidatus Erwinia haradaeae]|uniref:UPF0053 inner membrane protein YgdQ n=1 Tax=Candidatus Erwinia haradaeae TaxID=1922217 RepID=A0A451D7I6_9GAMM|nr:TerC family protein [Candidatus Erwinia haradaeae]VFP81788.1 Putative UPF0053 inner membrane protein YgdQ [Candidatus Erwinia haradaeae]